MKKLKISLAIILFGLNSLWAQQIPIDTAHWEIRARSYVLENFKGKDAIYLQGGSITLKDQEFLDGIIEYDIFLKEEPAFPGVYFRANNETGDAEQFYLRPHLSGKPDANQAAASTKNVTPWQLYFGPRYSFPYEYNYDDWTHVKIQVEGKRAQVFLDYNNYPHHSWELFHEPEAGKIVLTGGNSSGMHLANISVSQDMQEINLFKPEKREAIEGLIPSWEISDMFEEKLLENPAEISKVLEGRSWQGKISVEEGTAANISRIQNLRDGTPGNTVLAKIVIDSNRDQLKLFEFGYSDRVVAILNGQPIYWGNNRWRSRDYRYLGTIGLFDGIYLNLKRGRNELIMAVSEDFGGWLITGKLKDPSGTTIK